jgi:hypothetical protein
MNNKRRMHDAIVGLLVTVGVALGTLCERALVLASGRDWRHAHAKWCDRFLPCIFCL